MSEHTNTLSRRAFIGTAAAVGAATMAAPNIAFGATAAEKQAEADAVRNQLISLQADLETASDNYYGALDEQQAAQDAMAAEQAKIDDTNAQIQELQGKLSTRARSMYRTGSASFLDFVLGATSFDEFTSNWDLLTQMNNNDSEMVDTSKQLREQLQASKDEYARQEQIAADKAAEAAQIQQEVQAKVDQATELVNSLDAEAKELLEQEQAAAAAAAAAEAAAQRTGTTVLAAARAVAGQAAAVAPAVAAVTLAAAPMSPPMVLLSTTPCRASAAHMCGAPKVRTPSTALDLCAGHICKLAFPFRTKARRFTTAHHGAGLFLKLARAMFSGAAGTWESR